MRPSTCWTGGYPTMAPYGGLGGWAMYELEHAFDGCGDESRSPWHCLVTVPRYQLTGG